MADFPLQLSRFSGILLGLRRGNRESALLLAEHARRLAPNDMSVRYHTEWAFDQLVPRWHFPMLNDAPRNEVYQRSLERHITPNSVVLEIGAGAGLLAMIAARAGARHVYTCESDPIMVEVAAENIRKNGFSDQISLIPKLSTDVELGSDLPERADLLVSEIINSTLLGERALEYTADAQERLLKPDATILPDRIELCGTVVGGPEWTKFSRVGEISGLDFSAINWLAPYQVPLPRGMTCDQAENKTLLHFDLNESGKYSAGDRLVEIKVLKEGTVDAVVTWIRLRLGEGIEFENQPPTESHFEPVIHCLSESHPVKPNDLVCLKVGHNRRDTIVTVDSVRPADQAR